MDFLLCVYKAGHYVNLHIPLCPSYRLLLFYWDHCCHLSYQCKWMVSSCYLCKLQRGQQGQQRAQRGGLCVCVWGEEGAVFIWPGGAMGFLLIGLVQRPGANRVTGEKYCEKNPKRHFCLSWDIWQRSCEHTESSSGGSEWRGCEKERGREREREIHVSPN